MYTYMMYACMYIFAFHILVSRFSLYIMFCTVTHVHLLMLFQLISSAAVHVICIDCIGGMLILRG